MYALLYRRTDGKSIKNYRLHSSNHATKESAFQALSSLAREHSSRGYKYTYSISNMNEEYVSVNYSYIKRVV